MSRLILVAISIKIMCYLSIFLIPFVVYLTDAHIVTESNGVYDLSSSLDAAITVTVATALKKLQAEVSDSPRSMFGIRRIIYLPKDNEIDVEAELDWRGSSRCQLRFFHDKSDDKFEVTCGARKWRSTWSLNNNRTVESVNNGWTTLSQNQMSKLEKRLSRALAKLQKERVDPPLLLPVRVLSAQRQRTSNSTRYVIQANLSLPTRKCELEVLQRNSGYKRIIVDCDGLHISADSQ